MPNYAHGKIYCIRNGNDNGKIVYVGSTVRPLSERMADHRKAIKRNPTFEIYKLMSAIGVMHFYIELIADFPCERREQLFAKEGEYIRMHKDTIVNQRVAGRSTKDYYNENKERFSEWQKKYNAENAEAVRERCKKHYVANKASIDAYKHEWYTRNTEAVKARVRLNKEANKERIAAQQKLYRDAHKVEMAARKKAYYEANKAVLLVKQKAYLARKRGEIIAAQVPVAEDPQPEAAEV